MVFLPVTVRPFVPALDGKFLPQKGKELHSFSMLRGGSRLYRQTLNSVFLNR